MDTARTANVVVELIPDSNMLDVLKAIACTQEWFHIDVHPGLFIFRPDSDRLSQYGNHEIVEMFRDFAQVFQVVHLQLLKLTI